jgi:hypothetical protein
MTAKRSAEEVADLLRQWRATDEHMRAWVEDTVHAAAGRAREEGRADRVRAADLADTLLLAVTEGPEAPPAEACPECVDLRAQVAALTARRAVVCPECGGAGFIRCRLCHDELDPLASQHSDDCSDNPGGEFDDCPRCGGTGGVLEAGR